MAPSSLMTPSDAGAYLGLAENTLKRWRCQRVGPAYVKSGRLVYYRKDDLDAFLERNRIDPQSDAIA